MDTGHIKRVRAMLESQRDALSRRLHSRNAIAVEKAADTMDEVGLAEERDLANGFWNVISQTFVSWRQR